MSASWFKGTVLDVMTLDSAIEAVEEGGVDVGGNMDLLSREGYHLPFRWEKWGLKIKQNVRCLWNVRVNKDDRRDVGFDEVAI